MIEDDESLAKARIVLVNERLYGKKVWKVYVDDLMIFPH